MLIDMHAHSSGISTCCKADYRTLLDLAKETGLDGIVLTNHYFAGYVKDISVEEFIEKYINECHLSAAYAKEIGLKSFFGIEVTMEFDRKIHLLIYGVSEDFLRKNPYIFNMSLEELYTLVHENNGILIQAHPFRNGAAILNTDYLDGLEVNCHPGYGNTYSQEMIRACHENNLLISAGGDYHYDVPYRPNCGIHFPDELDSIEELKDHLLTSNTIELRIHELLSPEYDDYTFTKGERN